MVAWLSAKESSCQWGVTGDLGLISGSERFPGEGNDNPLQVFLPGKSHGQRSLVGYKSMGSQSHTRLSTHVYMSIPVSQFIPPLFPPWCPYICSLHLRLYFCFANKIICTVSLDSTYMCWYMILVSLFLSFFALSVGPSVHPRLCIWLAFVNVAFKHCWSWILSLGDAPVSFAVQGSGSLVSSPRPTYHTDPLLSFDGEADEAQGKKGCVSWG